MPAETLTVSRRDVRPTDLGDVLGPAEDRYFGAGYRDVRYTLEDPTRGPGSTGMASAIASAAYPERWSVGSDGSRRIPHLSSVDAIVLPLMVLEALTGSEDRERLSSLYVESIELRAGPTPWENLDAVPIGLELSGNDQLRTLSGSVGNIRSRLTLKRALGDGSVRPPKAEPTTVYGGLFQSNTSRTQSSQLVLAGPVLHASHQHMIERPLCAAPGVEADFWPAMTVIDYLVMMGQLTQGAVYSAGGTDRAHVGTLWMRTMKIALDGPPSRTPEFQSSTRLIRDRAIEHGGRRVHDVIVESSATTGVRARSSLAYNESTDR